MVEEHSQNQIIDRLVQGITLITENRCSLLDEDVILLKEVIVQLKKLKRKRKRNDATSLDFIIKAVELLIKFFVLNDDVLKIFDKLK